MDEAEWLTGTDPSPMLMVLRNCSSDRKRRLFAVAACRTAPEIYALDCVGPVLAAAERFADDHADSTLIDIFSANLRFEEVQVERMRREGRLEVAWLRMVSEIGATPVIVPQLRGTGWLLRDIFGNPFRPVAFDPAWRSEAAVGIARGIYDDRAFERLPILADTLQDAGCEHSDILAHCREPGTHVRGC